MAPYPDLTQPLGRAPPAKLEEGKRAFPPPPAKLGEERKAFWDYYVCLELLHAGLLCVGQIRGALFFWGTSPA
jgi:hypothetical protein